MLRKPYKDQNLRQFISYLFVGGAATLVEWALFWIGISVFSLNQNLSFLIAYIISTFANMMLGRYTTFKNASVVQKDGNRAAKALKETVLIYLVAALGCVLNIVFLNLFTIVFHMGSMLSKILTTAIVFVSNYLAKKLGIYRENPSRSASR